MFEHQRISPAHILTTPKALGDKLVYPAKSGQRGHEPQSPQASFQLESSSTFRHSPSLSPSKLSSKTLLREKRFLTSNKNKNIRTFIHSQDTAKVFRSDLKIIFPSLFFFCIIMRKVNFHLTRNIFIQIKFCANLDFSTRKQMHSEDRHNL